MLVPVVIFAQVLVPDGKAEERLPAEVERAFAAVRASVAVIGWRSSGRALSERREPPRREASRERASCARRCGWLRHRGLLQCGEPATHLR